MKTSCQFCKVLLLADAAPNTEVWMLNLEAGPILDAMGNVVPLPVEGARLFFLDYQPEANWTHDCGYVALTDYGLLYHKAKWPPHETIPKCRL